MTDQFNKQEFAITTQQAKQIATIKWLLYKAYNNNVPSELKEPFYYDERQQSMVSGKSSNLHLKPAIVYSLAKAELYCLALANIYLDPNYHNLNHNGIIQALARKGVVLSDPQLTETVLLQTSPLKLTAHLCVTEAIMMLYAKEIVTSERVLAAIRKFSSSQQQQRFTNDSNSNAVIPQWSSSDYDQLLLLWISETVLALNGRIRMETQTNDSEFTSDKSKNDYFKQIPVKELTELCDGVALCAVISYYCPQSIQWQKILANKPATNADYNHNLHMFYNFCQRCLPYPVFHMSPQDMFPVSINYMRINLIALLVDLFNTLEVHPSNCVVSERQNGTSLEPAFAAAQFEPAYTRRIGYNNIQKCPLTTQQMSVIPNLRNYTSQISNSSSESRTANSSPRADRKSRTNNVVPESQNNEQFIVHKGRNIPTLSSMNPDNCHKERTETIAAGKPTTWNDSRKSQITGAGGRRSRRNSFSDDSQLTIENFGGSHENLSVLGRNPDKEPAVHIVKINTSDDGSDNDASSRQLRCQMAAQENWSSAGISSLLRENNSDNLPEPKRPSSNASAASSATSASSASSDKVNGMKNFTSFQVNPLVPSAETVEMLESCKDSSHLLNVRLKLEEKRKQMEMCKRREEMKLKKTRQKLNQAAILQAATKTGKDNVCSKNNDDDDGGGNDNSGGGSNDISCDDIDNDSICAYDEVDKSDVVFGGKLPNSSPFTNQVEQRWLKNDIDLNGDISPKSDRQTPDSDSVDIEKCQKSISEMNSSIHALQTDLQYLAMIENESSSNDLADIGGGSVHHVDLSKPPQYPISFMLSQDQQQQQQQSAQGHQLQKILVNNHQNQNGFFANATLEYDNRTNYNTLPNKNYAGEFYADAYVQQQQPQHHHLSLLPTIQGTPIMKSPLPSVPAGGPSPQHMINPYDNEYYMYHQQHQQPPQHLHQIPQQPQPVHMGIGQNYKGGNYHSINVVDNDLRNAANVNTANFNYQNNPMALDDRDKRIQQQQPAQPQHQFYLHKPSGSGDALQAAFQFHNTSPVPTNAGYSTPSNMTSFSQRKTWDNSSSSSPIHSPTHVFSSARYGAPKEPTTVYNESKYKSKYSDDETNASLHNEPLNQPTKLDYSNYFASSRSDGSGRHSSAGSVSIPSPSADDMAPQCISFIGSQLDGVGKTSSGNDEMDDVLQLNENVNKLHISNGNRTYRIPSPTNKSQPRPNTHYAFNNEDKSKSEKGFYVSFSNDDDNFGKRFSERSPIKVPPRFKKAHSNSSLNNDKDRVPIRPPPRSKRPETISSLRENVNNSPDNNGTSNFRNVQKQNSDDSDKSQDSKISSNTMVIRKNNNPAALVISADTNNDPAQVDEMERKKERILLQSLQRRQQQEEMKARKEIELQRRKEQEKQKEELKAQKKEEEKRRRAEILEKHRLKKAIEEAEREGKPLDKELLNALGHTIPKSNSNYSGSTTPAPKLRNKNHYANRPRPKTIHIDVGSNLKDPGGEVINFNLSKKGSSVNLAEHNNNNNYGMSRRDYYRGSQDLLLAGTDIGNVAGTSASSIYSDVTDEDRVSYSVNGSTCGSIGRRRGSSYKTSRDVSLDRATSRIARPKFSTYQSYPRKSSSLMNLCGSSCDQDSFSYNSRYVTDTDSGLGRATPPHRTTSPAPSNSSPSGPGSLPPSHHSRRLRYDDTASESGGSEYSGLRLYKQPAVKSNRGIINNAIEYCVFPGEVNRGAKNRILDEVNKSDATKHFLVLFRDSRCQFRALYSYFPENEEVMKLYGTGPKQVTEKMFDKFFKYNSGGKCFTQVHTKHLTVTIDAFTIHNSLWQGKKVNLPNKRDMSLVI